MLKRLKNKLGVLQLISLILTIISLTVILGIISEKAANWIVQITIMVSGIIFYTRPKTADNIIQLWNGLDNLVHWGLLAFEVGGLIYLFGFFLRTKEVELIIKDKNLKPTPQ